MRKKYFLIITVIIVLSFLLIGNVLAQTTSKFGEGLNKTAEEIEDLNKETTLTDYIVFATQTFLTLIGIVFVGLLIYGGVTWMTAAGNQEQIGKAKKIIVQGVIGVVLIGAGHAITLFVVSQIEQPGEGVQMQYSEECLNPYQADYYSISCCEYRFQRDGSVHPQCCNNSPFFYAHQAACCALPQLATQAICSGGEPE